MRRFGLAAAALAAVGLCSVLPAQAGYSAIAAGVHGVGWSVGFPTMDSARNAAIAKCRELGGSCSVTTAEDDSWTFAAGHCGDVPYTAASPQGEGRAVEILYAKGAADGHPRCTVIKTF